LEKWNEVRAGEAMKNVLGMLRTGRFPGFEEVWMCLLASLEYRPKIEENQNKDSLVDL